MLNITTMGEKFNKKIIVDEEMYNYTKCTFTIAC